MNIYDSAHNSRRRKRRRTGSSSLNNRGSSFAADERRRTQEREARRAARAQKHPVKAIGADALTMSGARNRGMPDTRTRRPYGRGETARRVEAERQDVAELSSMARPAVYTREHQSVRDRLVGLSLPSVPPALLVLVLLAMGFFMLIGPVRTYYAAWREEGILQAEYEVVAAQNEELTNELESLQTLDGIEDEARARGYVYPNEEALVVEGVREPEITDVALTEQAIEEHEANLPWYVKVLDKLLGYTHQ